ncbi:efflux transporter outer membrane subunit [Chitinophaga varians]|uniref:efflux transporter outer membrane subunit n=1 Tax=Chitinophaga varians TaxID=2202339 RepID=UPI00165F9773|nr:efflux transporter outer membrane subunit [Chitinophaga varians]MBC9911853.1 efflux transporter outer membrane subunit [Chitinophaga varians]
MTHKKYIWLLALVTLAAACKVTRPYQSPEADTQNLFRDQPGNDTNTIAAKPWQSFFTDTLLQQLIARGIRENPDLRIAMQRIVAAQAALKQSKLAFLPDVNANASVKQSRLAFPQGYGLINTATQYDVNVAASWEVDVWGKLRSGKRAAQAALLGTVAAQQAVQSSLVADIAASYYSLLALDQQLLVLQQTLTNRGEDVSSMKELKAAGVVNGAAVVQSEANQYAAAVAIPDVKRQIRETENALSILLALPPGPISRSSITAQQLPQDLSIGIPAQLLQYRPDVKAAEYAFRNAFENTNVARTAFYPSLNITAAGGFTSFDFSQWFTDAGLFGNVVGGLTQPIFNRGLNKARLTTAQAKQQEALYNFSKTMLTAGKEVSDALYSLASAAEKKESREKQLASLEKAVDFTKELLRYSSSTNYTDVLTSEQNLLSAQMGSINDQLQQWQAVIALYRALGGK